LFFLPNGRVGMRGVPDLTSVISLNWPRDPKRYRRVMVLGAGHSGRNRGAFTARNGYRIAGQGARIAGQGARLLVRGSWIAGQDARAMVRGARSTMRGQRCAERGQRCAHTNAKPCARGRGAITLV